MKQSFWQGQTSEQLLDSLGNPKDIDVKILKTKKFGNITIKALIIMNYVSL